MKKVLLISNRVMHYRVSVYNYFARRFRENGCEWCVRTCELQSSNKNPLQFDLKEIPFRFALYRKEINLMKPDAVILFLHLKDRMLWPLMHWLKLKGIPWAFWTKGANLDDAGNRMRHLFFQYVHSLSDGLILYSPHEISYITPRNRPKVSYASNTINFEDFPAVADTKEMIKKEFSIPFRKVVLSVGRMDIDGGRKKIDHLLDIFRNFSRPDIGLVIAGTGMEKYRSMINPKNTLYLGEIHDPRNEKISKIFSMADVFCIPGHVGLGLNQAFHFGLPVVTEKGLQPPEIHYLADGRNGFLVEENDTGALRDKIIYLLENDSVREQFSRSAREDINKNASIEGMFGGFLECIQKITK